MSLFKVIKGRWGEGWMPGDLVHIDEEAASSRLANGDIVRFVEAEVPVTPPPTVPSVSIPSVQIPSLAPQPQPEMEMTATTSTIPVFTSVDPIPTFAPNEGQEAKDEYNPDDDKPPAEVIASYKKECCGSRISRHRMGCKFRTNDVD